MTLYFSVLFYVVCGHFNESDEKVILDIRRFTRIGKGGVGKIISVSHNVQYRKWYIVGIFCQISITSK